MKTKCYLCGAEGKLVDAKVIDHDLEGLAVCDSNTGCHIGVTHQKPREKKDK